MATLVHANCVYNDRSEPYSEVGRLGVASSVVRTSRRSVVIRWVGRSDVDCEDLVTCSAWCSVIAVSAVTVTYSPADPLTWMTVSLIAAVVTAVTLALLWVAV